MWPLRRQPGPRPDPDGSLRAALPDPLPAGQLLDGLRRLGPSARARPARHRARHRRARATSARSEVPSHERRRLASPCHGIALAGVPAAGAVAAAAARRRDAVRRRAAGRAADRRAARRRAAARLGQRLDRMARRDPRARAHAAPGWTAGGACIDPIRVDQVGDAEHRWGFHYDERDGTGSTSGRRWCGTRGHGPARPAPAPLPAAGCLSRAAGPERHRRGRARHAAAAAAPSAGSVPADTAAVGCSCGGWSIDSDGRARIDGSRTLERFDEWESCLSWLPVTEAGDDDQDLGYLYDGPDGAGRTAGPRHRRQRVGRPRLQLLAFLGRDRPFSRRVRQRAGRVRRPAVGPGRPAVATAVAGSRRRPTGSTTCAETSTPRRRTWRTCRAGRRSSSSSTSACSPSGSAPEQRPGYRYRTRDGRPTQPRRAVLRHDRPAAPADGPDGVPGRGAAADRVQRGRRRAEHRRVAASHSPQLAILPGFVDPRAVWSLTLSDSTCHAREKDAHGHQPLHLSRTTRRKPQQTQERQRHAVVSPDPARLVPSSRLPSESDPPCPCGRPALVIFTTEEFGDVIWCGA